MPQVRLTHANQALKATAALWFAVAIAGQAVFIAYIVSFYGRAVLADDWSRWNKVLAAGYIRGDRVGNLALAGHLALAVLITAGGPLQLIPQVRARWPSFHRWLGRSYLLVAVTTSIAGVWMTWTRKVVGDLPQHLGSTLDAALIMLCAGVALRHALRRDFGAHRRWALRLFLVVSGSWFFRVGLLFWLLVNRGPVGFDADTFRGPALSVLSFAESLLPLLALEIYLRARDGLHALAKLAASAGLLVLTACMGIGILGAAMSMWIPHI